MSPVIDHDNLLIKTFGEESSRLPSCELVQVAVKSVDGTSLYVSAYVVSVICTPPSNQYLQVAIEQYPYLADLELAESVSNSQEEIGILIGADYYWTFMTGHSRRGGVLWPCCYSHKIWLGFVRPSQQCRRKFRTGILCQF